MKTTTLHLTLALLAGTAESPWWRSAGTRVNRRPLFLTAPSITDGADIISPNPSR